MPESFHFPEKVTPINPKTGEWAPEWMSFLRSLNSLLPFTHLVGEISLAQLVAHAATHKAAGTDAIKLDELAAPTDNTNLNATTGRHGLLPKLSGNAAHTLKGDGTWS